MVLILNVVHDIGEVVGGIGGGFLDGKDDAGGVGVLEDESEDPLPGLGVVGLFDPEDGPVDGVALSPGPDGEPGIHGDAMAGHGIEEVAGKDDEVIDRSGCCCRGGIGARECRPECRALEFLHNLEK